MQPQNQNTTVIPPDGGEPQSPPSLVVAPEPVSPGNLSLESSGSYTPDIMPGNPQRDRFRRLVRVFLKWGTLATVVFVLVGVGALLVWGSRREAAHLISTNPSDSFEPQVVPLESLAVDISQQAIVVRQVIVNGQLRVGEGMVLTPSLQPSSSEPGQLYYDQSTNLLGYFNGTEFVYLDTVDVPEVAPGVEQIAGLTGQIGLGPGLTVAGGLLVNSGVVSLGDSAGTISLGPGLTMAGNVLQNSGVLNIVGGSGIQVASDGSGTYTITNVGAGNGTVSSSGGTVGRIPVFTNVQNIEDSLISQSGMTVTVSGDLHVVTGGLSLSNPLTVSNGGTGTTSLAPNGVLIGNGTGPVTAVTAGAPNLCLLSTAGAPIFAACPSASGVTTLNGLNGALSIAHASGAGTTITIDNASTSAKGIAQFNSANFSDNDAGVINTIQDIHTGATPTFAGLNTNSINPSSVLTVGAAGQTAFLQGSTTAITAASGDIVLTSAGQIRLTGFNCSAFANGGTLTTDASGNLICANDDGGAGGGGVTSLNSFVGDLSLQGTAGQIVVDDDGGDTLTLSLDSNVTLQGNTFNGANQLVQLNGDGELPAVSGVNLTNLNASALATGTVPSSVMSGSYTGITGVGTISTGTWQGTAIAIAYGGTGATTQQGAINNLSGLTTQGDLLYHNGTNVTRLARGSNGECLVSTATTIQWGSCLGGGALTGSGTPGTIALFTDTDELGDSILSQSSNTITVGGTLNVTDQIQINGVPISSADLSDGSNLAKLNASQTFTGNTNAFRNGSDSTNAFNIQNAAGVRVLTINTTAGQVELGVGGVLNGSLVFYNANDNNTVTILSDLLTDNRTILLPDADGTICLDTGNCADLGATLQTAYNFSVGGTVPKIKVNDTLLGVEIQDADISINDYLLTVRASDDTGLGQVMFGVNSAGEVVIQGSENSATALQLLTSGGTSVLTGDTENGQVILGQRGTLTGALLFSNASNNNLITLTSQTATATRTITLPDASGTICLTSGNCAGVGGVGDILQGGNSFGATMTIGTNDNNDLVLERNNATRLTIGASDITLASGIDLLLQGPNAFISNPQGQTDSEAFGLGATVTASAALAVGNSTLADGEGAVAIGYVAQATAESTAVGGGAIADGFDAIAVGTDTWAIGSGTIALGGNAVADASNAIAIGQGADSGFAGSIAIGVEATTTAANQLVIGSSSSAITQAIIGNGVRNANPLGFVLQGTSGLGTNIAGADVTIAAGQGTGSANGGDINFQIAAPGSSGSGLNALVTVMQLSGADGAITIQNAADSATAFRILDQSGANVALGVDHITDFVWSDYNVSVNATLDAVDVVVYDELFVEGNSYLNGNVTVGDGVGSTTAFRVLDGGGEVVMQIDTINHYVYIGNPTTDSTGALLVLDTKDTEGDPDGVEGGMYYNSALGKFRCYQAGIWADCLGGGVYSDSMPTRVGELYSYSPNTTAPATIDVSDVPNGSWLLLAVAFGSSNASPSTPVGWTTIVNQYEYSATRKLIVMGKIKEPSDTVVSISKGTTTSYASVGLVYGSGGSHPTQWQVGEVWTRGGSTLNQFITVAPSVTTKIDNSLALGLSFEATNATEGFAPVTSGDGWDNWLYVEDTGDGTNIDQIRIAYKEMPTAGDTGDATDTYANSQVNNGAGVQVIVTPSVGYFVGATDVADGKAGLVPAPMAGKQGSLLVGDGAWSDGLTFLNATVDRGLVLESTGSAFIILNADTDDDGNETGNAYIGFKQDASTGLHAVVGTIQQTNIGPDGDTVAGALTNALYIGSADELQFGTDGVVRITITATGQINIGASDTTGTLLVLDTKINNGDPSPGVDGAMYYNAAMGVMRCHMAGRWQMCNGPRSLSWGYNIEEDFVGPSLYTSSSIEIQSLYGWRGARSGTGSDIDMVNPDNSKIGRPGWVVLTVGNSGSWTQLYLDSINGQLTLGGGEVIETNIFIDNLSTSNQEYEINIGLCNANEWCGHTGIFFEYYRPGSGDLWRYRACTNENCTTGVSSKSVQTGNTSLRIVVNSPTSVTYYVKHESDTSWTTLGTITTNIPALATQNKSPFVEISKQNGNSARSFGVDYFHLRHERTTTR